jgi:hypothetical protein
LRVNQIAAVRADCERSCILNAGRRGEPPPQRHAAAQTRRVVSGGGFWPSRRELSQHLKYMALARIPEFESPSQSVHSLRCDFQVCENRRHSGGLGWCARVSVPQFPDFRSRNHSISKHPRISMLPWGFGRIGANGPPQKRDIRAGNHGAHSRPRLSGPARLLRLWPMPSRRGHECRLAAGQNTCSVSLRAHGLHGLRNDWCRRSARLEPARK